MPFCCGGQLLFVLNAETTAQTHGLEALPQTGRGKMVSKLSSWTVAHPAVIPQELWHGLFSVATG